MVFLLVYSLLGVMFWFVGVCLGVLFSLMLLCVCFGVCRIFLVLFWYDFKTLSQEKREHNGMFLSFFCFGGDAGGFYLKLKSVCWCLFWFVLLCFGRPPPPPDVCPGGLHGHGAPHRGRGQEPGGQESGEHRAPAVL